MISEKQRIIIQPSSASKPRAIQNFTEFLSAFVFVALAEVLNVSHLFVGNKGFNIILPIMYIWPLIFLIVYCKCCSCPWLLNAHSNPAVTLTLAYFGHFPMSHVAPYLWSQLLGAVAATSSIHGIYKAAPVEAFLDPALASMTGPFISINNLSPDELGVVMLMGPIRSSWVVITQVVFIVGIGTHIFMHTQYIQKTNIWFLEGPGYVVHLAVLHFAATLLFQGWFIFNSAHALASQITSFILYGTALLEWSYLPVAFVNIPAIMLLGAMFHRQISVEGLDSKTAEESGDTC